MTPGGPACDDDVRRAHLAACRACRALHDYAHEKRDADLLEAARRQLNEHTRFEKPARAPRRGR